MKYHISLSISGAIRNKSFKGFADDKGNPMPPKVAEAHLKIMQYEGKKLMKIVDCDNWDEEKGCLGHPEEKEQKQ